MKSKIGVPSLEQLRVLAKEIKEILTDGWSQHERSHWEDFLREEVQPFYSTLFQFLKDFGEEEKAKP